MSFPRYEHYKDTGVEWLADVPEHWQITRLKNTTSECRNGIWGADANGDEWDIACVRVADFDRNRLCVCKPVATLRNVTEFERNGRLLRRGNLLLEKSGGGDLQPVGCVVLYDSEQQAVCSNFVARVETAVGFDSSYCRYLHAAIYALRLSTRSINQTSGIQNLDQSAYLNELAALPPEDEQTAIANFLDRETAKFDALIEEQRRLIELLKEKRQAVISHVLTKGIAPSPRNKKTGVSWIGEIPEQWNIQRLSDLIRTGTTITYGIVQAGPDIEDGIPYIRTSDLAGDQLPASGYLRTSQEIDHSYRRSKVSAGDLVIALRSSVGKALLVPPFLEGANLTQGTAKFSPSSSCDVRYVAFYLNTVAQAEFDIVAKGATFKEVTLDKLRRITVCCPPPCEQVAIADFLDRKVNGFRALESTANNAVQLLQERRSALISAAVTGKIDVRNYTPKEAA